MTGDTDLPPTFSPVVSMVADATSTATSDIDVHQIIEEIRGPKHKARVAAVRRAFESGGKKAADLFKKKLPGVTWTGRFSERNGESLVEYSHLVCADLDNLGSTHAEALIPDLQRDPHVAAAFRSPTGSGVKAIFRVAGDADQHAGNFAAVKKHVADTYGVPIDESGKDLARLCFISNDETAFYNDQAVPLEPLPENVYDRRQMATAVATPGRQQIAESILGPIQWSSDTDGLCQCPGQHLHTGANGKRDCAVFINGAPTVKCFHESCSGIVAGINHELRSRIGKAETLPMGNKNGEELAPQPKPSLKAKSLAELRRREKDDPSELLRTGFLCRKAFMLLCGPTGVGKSSLGMQAMILWMLGKPAFGIEPARSIKSILIQAENDDGDLAEMRDGVIAGLGLTTAEVKQATGSIITIREDEHTGMAFFVDVVRPLLTEHRPDLLWIDPALAYLGGDTSSQRDVGGFLRNQLNPVLREFDCGCVITHHTNKPPSGKEKPEWNAGDFAYLGSGSAEWANAARAVLALRSIGSHDVFELRAGKRGGRLGWRDQGGQRSYVRHLAHATEGVICWNEAEGPDTGGRPKTHDATEILGLLPPEGLKACEWQKLSATEYGIKEATFHRKRRELEASKMILRSVSGKWQPIKRA
jgi:hypothetical protein